MNNQPNKVLLLDISRLAPIKENVPEYVTYDQIKITLSILKYEYLVTIDAADDEKPVAVSSERYTWWFIIMYLV